MVKPMKTKWIAILLIVAALAACTPGYMPIREGNVRVREDIAFIDTPDYSIAVQPALWTYKPDNLSDYYTTFIIQVENKTRHSINVQPTDIVLLNENRRQYDPVSIDRIISMLVDEAPALRHFSETPVNLREEQEYEMDRLEARQKLMSESFHFGDISAKASKSGYVFFPKVSQRNMHLSFVFKDQTIRFTREKKEEK